ncbi:hypothetical protein P8452_56827 [Trifolium repens]|nr:hypothetical protein P8452_56827 [Trifolium repens]
MAKTVTFARHHQRDKTVPDASASLAQDKPQDEMANDVVADSPMQLERDVPVNVNTDNAMSVDDNVDYVTADEAAEEEGANEDDSTEEDVTIMKIVGDSRKKAGKTGVGSRLRESVVSTSMNRKAMIITMEAAVKALDEQKTELEKVIFALKQEQAEEEGLAGDNAGVDAGISVGAADGDAAEDDDGDAGGDTEELEVSNSSGSF